MSLQPKLCLLETQSRWRSLPHRTYPWGTSVDPSGPTRSRTLVAHPKTIQTFADLVPSITDHRRPSAFPRLLSRIWNLARDNANPESVIVVPAKVALRLASTVGNFLSCSHYERKGLRSLFPGSTYSMQFIIRHTLSVKLERDWALDRKWI